MQPYSWIEPHPIQKVIKPKSKADFETIQTQLEYNPTRANFGIFEIDGHNETSNYTYSTVNEQHLESGFLHNHTKMTFFDSFDFQGLTKVVKNYDYEWAIN